MIYLLWFEFFIGLLLWILRNKIKISRGILIRFEMKNENVKRIMIVLNIA